MRTKTFSRSVAPCWSGRVAVRRPDRGTALPRALLAAALALAAACPVFAQAAATGSGTSGTAAAAAGGTQAGGSAATGAPKASPGAMPPGFGPSTSGPENRLRRFEIVSLGAFPIMLFYAGFAFDLQGYFAHGFDKAYAPWPFKNASSASLSNRDIYLRLSASLGLSFVVGGIDAVLHARKLRKAEEESAPGAP